MSGDLKQFTLAANYRLDEDRSLMVFLNDHKDHHVQIAAASIQRVETMLLQLLLCAAKSWRARGLTFELTEIADRVDADLIRLGVTPDMLERRVAI